jgi:hypothetical protein
MDISGKKLQTQNLAEQISKVFENSNTRVFEFIPIKIFIYIQILYTL